MPTLTSSRLTIADWIVRQEMRVDRDGNPKVYNLPANDGGGRYEVAGLNEKYNKAIADELVKLIGQKQYADVWRRAAEEIAKDTDGVLTWGLAMTPGEEAILRDCWFNRGGKGAARILQIALLVPDDGQVGPQTRAALAKHTGHPDFLTCLRHARELYEWRVVGHRENLWPGLVNRWNNALAFAQSL